MRPVLSTLTVCIITVLFVRGWDEKHDPQTIDTEQGLFSGCLPLALEPVPPPGDLAVAAARTVLATGNGWSCQNFLPAGWLGQRATG